MAALEAAGVVAPPPPAPTLPEAPPIPQVPLGLATSRLPVRDKLRAVQKYIEAFEYNHTGRCYYATKKYRGFSHVANIAQEIMREALPIQCVEATFLGAYLTCDVREVERYPVSFKSTLEGHEHRHIVLAVTAGGRWGALGISRRDCLAYKDLRYASFGELLCEFAAAYASVWHTLECAYVGLPLPRNPSCNAPIRWKVMKVDTPGGVVSQEVRARLDGFDAAAPKLLEQFLLLGRLPPHPLINYGMDCAPSCATTTATTAAAGGRLSLSAPTSPARPPLRARASGGAAGSIAAAAAAAAVDAALSGHRQPQHARSRSVAAAGGGGGSRSLSRSPPRRRAATVSLVVAAQPAAAAAAEAVVVTAAGASGGSDAAPSAVAGGGQAGAPQVVAARFGV